VDTVGRLRGERLVHLKDVDVRNTQPHLQPVRMLISENILSV
jgi:hypothetical protein